MSVVLKKRQNTRLVIIQLAAHLFLEDGYSASSIKKIAKILKLSPGNITFYFPSKDHMLAELVDELFDFQNMMMEQAAEEGKSSLLAYCLELATIASICEEDAVAKEFYFASYSSPYTLARIRENDTKKTKAVFQEYCPDFTDEDWVSHENIVSGIEYATIMTSENTTPLSTQIEQTLDAILLFYKVPEEIRRKKIEKVLSMDYRTMGRRILKEFRDYIDKINETKAKKAPPKKPKKRVRK